MAFLLLSREFPELQGLIVGGWGPEDAAFQARLARRTGEAGLASRLRFLGYRADVASLLPAFDLLVHASTRPEPFGMVILEAMAAGLPVVASNLGGPREIVLPGVTGLLVPPSDPAALAEACRGILSDHTRAAAMGAAGRERVREHFHLRTTVERTTALFEAVLGLEPAAGKGSTA